MSRPERNTLRPVNTDRAAPSVSPSIHLGRRVAPSNAMDRRLLLELESKNGDSVSPPVIQRALSEEGDGAANVVRLNEALRRLKPDGHHFVPRLWRTRNQILPVIKEAGVCHVWNRPQMTFPLSRLKGAGQADPINL